MNMTNSIIEFRRYLKRRNYSKHTIKNYLHSIKQFVLWVDVPIEEMTPDKISAYIDHLMKKGLSSLTINCNLYRIKAFYNYLHYEKELSISVPVKTNCRLRTPKPLPRFLRDEDVERFLEFVKGTRDHAMCLVMLRCGLRVEEVANLTRSAIDLKQGRIMVYNGKGMKDRVALISRDARHALARYLRQRSSSRVERVFLVEKGIYKGKPISVRGIQKRIESYAKKSGIKVSCHRLRHTMATQMLNADAKMVTIQDLLGHARIATTERYSKVSNLTVQRDYHKTMNIVTDENLKGGIVGDYKKFFTKEKRQMLSDIVSERITEK
mgnify:CR=1 FL=1